ncbi:GbsR/MarR family transcriptional regulator [Microbacterium gilvum]|uniref:Transcriptional regulator n=1 Tax=Microbacterium gilvum TaxID=1336204 RepID=A0ABP8ZVH3_9MICO
MTSNEQHQFINAMGDTLATWQLSRSTGRVYGYLLLRGTASSSEELRDDLALSSGAVSTAVRDLVSWGLARTLPQPGSRRLLVEAAGGFEQLLAASHERTRAFIRTLEAAERLTDSSSAAARLRDVTDLFASYVDAAEQALRAGSRS